LGETGNQRKSGIDWKLIGWFEIERFAIVLGAWVYSDGAADESQAELQD
jgi:hypothetical protein